MPRSQWLGKSWESEESSIGLIRGACQSSGRLLPLSPLQSNTIRCINTPRKGLRLSITHAVVSCHQLQVGVPVGIGVATDRFPDGGKRLVLIGEDESVTGAECFRRLDGA